MELHERVSKLEDDVTDIKTRMAVAETNIKDIKDDISSIKSNTNWILRLIIGAIVSTVMGLILKGGL